MGATLKNMLTFAPQNVTPYAWIPLIAIWLLVVLVILIDVAQTSHGKFKTSIWIMTVILLPGLSAVIYAICGIVTSIRKPVARSGQ
jgi:hypothetical protein